MWLQKQTHTPGQSHVMMKVHIRSCIYRTPETRREKQGTEAPSQPSERISVSNTVIWELWFPLQRDHKCLWLKPPCLRCFVSEALKWASLVTRSVKNPPAMQETCVPSLGLEDPLQEGMATHSCILAWETSCRTLAQYSPRGCKASDIT